MKFKILLILITIALGLVLRLYKLDSIPPGLNHDEVSTGYNAYSLLTTGKDRYGQNFPLAFRSFNSYILPLYTYLTIIPTAVFGQTILSARLVTAISSILLLVITTLFIFEIKNISFRAKLITIFLMSISPWALYFGRAGHEINLGSTLFILSTFLFIKSLSAPVWIVFSLLVAGISGSSDYSSRYLSLITMPVLIWMFKDRFKKYKKYIFAGIFIFLLLQIPNLVLMNSESFARRIEQVNYFNDNSFNESGGRFKYMPLGRAFFILNEFVTHYVEYFSPRSLFFDQDPQRSRSIPDLSVFYPWMVLPFWFGLKILLKNKSNPIYKILLVLLIITPIPAALTGDPFYTFRVLSFLWVLTIIISLGSDNILKLIPTTPVKVVLSLSLVTTSLVSLYSSYFILLKYERADIYGYEYKVLADKLRDYPDKKIVVDTGRLLGPHLWIPFYAKIDPIKYQLQTNIKIKKNYYSNTDSDKITEIDNYQIKPIVWKEDLCENKVLIGDALAISEEQIQRHQLKELFRIKGLDGKDKLFAYEVPSKDKCNPNI